jgi:hypothetical protein
VQDNSIRIGKVIITPKSDGYRVYDLTNKKNIGKTYSKRAALALAKQAAKNTTCAVNEILSIDRHVEKYDNDCCFYRHSILNSKDEFKRETIEIRYDDALYRRSVYVDKLDRFIF